MSKVTVQRHDGEKAFYQEIDEKELGAFEAAGFVRVDPADVPKDEQDEGSEASAKPRTPQTKGSRKPKA